jgi:hypothetical protein
MLLNYVHDDDDDDELNTTIDFFTFAKLWGKKNSEI